MSLSVVSPSGTPRRSPVLRAALRLAGFALLGWNLAGPAWSAQAPGAAGPEPPSLKELTGSSDYVFRGTVVRTASANLELVEPTERTAVVRVDEVLKASSSIDDFTGREVTVIASAPLLLREGQRQIFFGNVGLAGESLGILTLGSVADGTRLKGRIAQAQAQVLEESLQARIAAADLAVVGRVLSTRATYEEPKSGVLTEHDPLWWEAELEVTSVLRGELVQKTVPFYFPSGQDAMWAPAPKATPGRAGTWLLHRYEVAGRGFVLAVLNSDDLLTPAEAKVAQKWVKP